MRISGSNISMVRGDTESFVVACRDEAGIARPFSTGETVYFTVGTKGGRQVLQKVITAFSDTGEAQILLSHADTNGIPPDEYLYDVQLTMRDGAVKTIITPSNFTIERDVTRE